MKDKDNKNPDAIVDVMARAEDASKINRIVERFNLASTDKVSITREDVKENNNIKAEVELEVPQKDDADKLLDDVLAKPLQKEEQSPNPQQAKMEKSPLSEPSSNQQKKFAEGTTKADKPSVKEQLREIKQSRKEQEEKAPVIRDKDKDVKKPATQQTKHTQPTQIGRASCRERVSSPV